MYRVPARTQRTSQILRLNYEPRTKKLKESLLFKYNTIYNQLPHTLKQLPKEKFKVQIKVHIKNNKEYHTIPDTGIGDSDESE